MHEKVGALWRANFPKIPLFFENPRALPRKKTVKCGQRIVVFYSVKKVVHVCKLFSILTSGIYIKDLHEKDALHLHTCMQSSYKTATKTQEY